MFKRIEIESLKVEISKINEAHWAEDYNDACSRPDYTLRRRLVNRITPLLRDALALGMVVSSECGPCAKFGFELKGE